MSDDETMVKLLARELAKARTGGNVYMDGGHNPLPTEYVTARQFLEPLEAQNQALQERADEAWQAAHAANQACAEAERERDMLAQRPSPVCHGYACTHRCEECGAKRALKQTYDVALGVLRGFTMGEEVGSQALSVIESQNQALQEENERLRDRNASKRSENVLYVQQIDRLLADKAALQERAVKAEALLRRIWKEGLYEDQTSELIESFFSPTQETDPE